MRIVANFDPTTETNDTFNAGFANGTGKMVVYNESNLNLQLSWGTFQTYCPAWTACLYCVSTNNVNINWVIQSTLITSGAPISQVIVEVYDPGEPVLGTFPAPLVRQTNIGNASAVGGTATAISNTGNPALTPLITAQPSDAASNTWTGDTSGNLTIKSDNAGVLTTLLQLIAGASPAVKLAAAAVLTEVLGTLQVDSQLLMGHEIIMPNNIAIEGKNSGGTAQVMLNMNTDNSLRVSSGGAGSTIFFTDSTNGTMASVSSAAITAPNGVNYNVGRIKDINNGSNLSGTINHGLSGTPGAVLATCDTVSSSATVGASSYTSTQFGLTIGGGLNGRWVAYR